VSADTDPATLLLAATEFATAAGALLCEGYGIAHRPERKGRIDLVTEYDRRSERLLLDAIARRFPGHAVLAEESGDHAVSGSRVRWLVDPLDGTTNFAHNYPFFAVSIAAEVDGVLTAGAVYDPVREEMFAAARDKGATLNGEPIHVSDIDRIEDALLVTGFPYDVREHTREIVPLFEAFLVRAQGIRRDGSAALNLCYLACGRFDGFWEGYLGDETTRRARGGLSAWDMAAGTLIAREAGGTVTDFATDTLPLDGRQLLATNGRLHDAMRAVVRGARPTGS